MRAPVPAGLGQLLENIHIPKLEIIMFADMVIKSEKNPVLVKIVVDDLFSKINVYLIIYHEGKSMGLEFFRTKGKLRKKIVPEPEIKIIPPS
jgi:hypothetical protein